MTATHLHAPLGGRRQVSPRPRRGRSSRFVETALAAFRDWRKRAHDRNEFAALDDRTLRDIGICRSDTLYLTKKADENHAWSVSLRFPPF
jgi:uncharacterized protein YjiS (DUF1127 family)